MTRSGFAYGLSLATFIVLLAGTHVARAQAQAAPTAPAPSPATSAAPAPAAAPAPVTAPAPAPDPSATTAPALIVEPAVEPSPAPPPPPVYSQPPAQAQAPDYETAPRQQDSGYSDRPRKRRSVGLMIAGLATLGGSYALSALVGLQLSSGESTAPGTVCTNCDEGTKLLIPIAGPWLFLPDADGGDGKALSAILGVAQATGVVLSIFGIAKFVDSAPDGDAQAMPRLMVGVAPLPHGAHASMHLQF